MSGRRDETERRLEQSLNRNASAAPADDQLLDEVQHRVGRRRRTARIAGTVILAAAAVFAVITASTGLPDLGRPAEGQLAGPGGAAQADGSWRWESYGKVELQVPAGWRYGGDPSQWCSAGPERKPAPYIHRPGASTSMLCPDVPDLAKRASYVDFNGAKAGVREFDHGWVRETRTIAGTAVTVFTDDAALRARIFASAREISGTDLNGCAAGYPGAGELATRPKTVGGGLGSEGEVKSVSVCGYELPNGSLYTGRTFTGTAATDLVEAILSAPGGTGPNSPPTECLSGEQGDRLYLLTVHGTEHDQQVLVRYAGCDHNGTDDGTTRRRLTRAVLQPILAGPDAAYTANGPVGDLLG